MKTEGNQQQFNGVLNAAKSAFKYLHKKGTYDPSNITDEPYMNLIKETQKIFDSAIQDNVMPEAMMRSLQKDAFVFSGLKTHAQLLEAHSYLLDNNGNKRPYNEFEQDVLKLNDTYNTSYLEAEYQFATSSAQMAAKWANYEADGDRYNLQYRTANDDRVRKSHAVLQNITLPSTDDFWSSYFPPNGWRCRCTAVQVRKGKYEESNSADAMGKADKATTELDKNGNNKLAMFRFNSGKDKVLMPPKNAYTKVAGAKKVKETLKKEINKK